MDPTLKARTVAAMKERMAILSPQMRAAAKYIIDHQADFGLSSIRETARKAGISTYTLVNIAKNLGFSGFEDLRHPFRQALIESPMTQGTSDRFEEIREQGPMGNVFADSAKNAVSIVTRSLEHQELVELEAITEMLLSAKNVYLTAARSSYALAYYLHYVGRMALPTLRLIPRHMNNAIDDLNDAKPGDVLIAITVTPYSLETINACVFAEKRGVKLIFISDSEVVSPELTPDHVLVVTTHSTHNFGCFSGMIAVIETLLAFLMHRGGQEASARIESYDKLHKENSAYWVAQKKH